MAFPDTNNQTSEKVQGYANLLAESWLKDYKKDKEYYARQTTSDMLASKGYVSVAEMETREKEKFANQISFYVAKLLSKIAEKDKTYLKEVLHSGNKTSRTIFEKETGVSLGKTNKSMNAVINSW